jgi:murein DD-endopeptidase MepM/ murein hydrolase activator NlpD
MRPRYPQPLDANGPPLKLRLQRAGPGRRRRCEEWMRLRRHLPALAVALAASAALGPPAAAAPGEDGGAVAAPPGEDGDSGGTGYGQPVPRPPKRRAARRSTKTGHHRFPIAGPFGWGGADARFGARRKGHRHQGQDLSAAAGAPVVAPHAGVVEEVGYQAGGAGHYVVLDGDHEDYDYVFMHLRTRSVAIAAGEQVRTGQRIGEVGSTGRSSGPHLHFEIWVGGWFAGGHPIDPLPLLQAWSGVSPASG